MKIQNEIEQSRQYMLKTFCFKGKELVQILPDNVYKVEAMIKNDSAYRKTFDKNAAPNKKNPGGSTAYWMAQLSNLMQDANIKNTDQEYRNVIEKVVISIDSENSTHLNADGVGRKEISARISEIEKIRLQNLLKYPRENNFELIKIISEKTHPEDASKKARANLSFASKFCHYACFFLFEGTEFQDNFSIHDGVLENALRYYADYYEIKLEKDTLTTYAKYSQLIDSIIEKNGNLISRNGFDHLLWYYFKARAY